LSLVPARKALESAKRALAEETAFCIYTAVFSILCSDPSVSHYSPFRVAARKALESAKRALAEETAFCSAYLSSMGGDIVRINASGVIVNASSSTIRAVEGSMLASLFDQERWTLQPDDLDDEGNYFMVRTRGATAGLIGNIK
jgi:hypothetical protein